MIIGYRTKILLKKYHQLAKHLQKIISSDDFQKKAKLFQRLCRYERQLQRLGIAAGLSLNLLMISQQAQSQDCDINGNEFLVNTETNNGQRSPDVAMDADGDFVVVWQSNIQDGSNYGIFGQRYQSGGTPLASEFRINTETVNTQNTASVAMDADGNFVVVWESFGQDGDQDGIYGQLYQSDGTSVGSEFLINSETNDIQERSSVAMDADGDFVVVWESRSQDGSGDGIYGQRYNDDGTTAGSEFLINTYTTGAQEEPNVAMDADGNFVVVWESSGQDGSNRGIYGQRFNSDGTNNGNEFLVNTFTSSTQENSSVAMDADGDFVVIWSSFRYGYTNDIYAQRYQSTGIPQGVEFRVNTEPMGFKGGMDVEMDADGDFVVVWEGRSQDGSGAGVYGRRFQNDGTPLEDEFQINTYTTNYQSNPSIGMDADGDFITVWNSDGQDGSLMGVYGQGFQGRCPELCDTDVLGLSGTEDGTQTYSTQAEITSTQSIEAGAVVVYQAATTIELQLDFHAKSNSNFIAKIEDCSAASSASEEAVAETRSAGLLAQEIPKLTTDQVQVYPNPTNGQIQVVAPNKVVVQNILLYDQFGKLIRQIDSSERELSLTDVVAGFYILAVKTEEGYFLKKVVKK